MNDLRYSVRKLRWNPGFTAIAVLSLALGIGANTVIFSLVNAILLTPLRYHDPERLTMVWMDNRRLGLKEDLTSWPNYQDWKQNQSFQSMAAFTDWQTSLMGSAEPELLSGAQVTADLFPLLGVRPEIGRTFTVDEEQPGKDGVAVISHGLWQRRFGGARDIQGKTLLLGNNSATIVGVMPEGFAFPAKDSDIWSPLALRQQTRESRGSYFLSVVGRLKKGVVLEQARAEMTGIGKRLEKQYGEQNEGYGVYVVPLLEQIVGSTKLALWVMLGAVVFVLLIACANLAGLSLARGASREREIALRTAIGAGRWRLIRQLMTESMLVSLVSGGVAVLVALWGVALFKRFAPEDTPRLADVAIDWRVLLFTLAISIAAGVLAGLAPAWKISRCDLQESLKESGAGSMGGLRSRRLRSVLVAGELAVAVMLLTGAGLLVRSFVRLRSVDAGFQPERVLRMQVSLSQSSFPQGAPQAAAAWQQLIGKLSGSPGVRGVGLITDIFLSSTPNSGSFSIEGRAPLPPAQQIEATRDVISNGYFKTMGVALRRGRFFTDQDGAQAPPVVIINETMAKWFWPKEDPVGRRFRFGGQQSTAPWMTIVGVAADMRRQGLEKTARAETFLPMAQRPRRSANLVIRGVGDPLKLANLARGEVRAIDKNALIYGITTIEEMVAESLSKRRMETWLLGLFSATALALAAIGIYGLMAFSVAQRTHEIGIRMALGAERREVVRMILRQGLGLAVIGAAVGLVGAFALTRFMATMLYGVTPGDPISFAIAAVLLACVTLIACWQPARRATRVSPIAALRYE